MKPSTLTLSVLLVGAVAYAGFLQVEVNRLRALADVESGSTPLASEAGSRSGPMEGRKAGPGDAAADEGSVRPEESAAVAESAAQAPSASGISEWQQRRRERMDRMRAAFEDPQMRVDMIEREMNRVDSRYAGFFKGLDLGREDLDTLRLLLAESGVVNWEMRMRGFGVDSPEQREQLDRERRFQRDVLMEEIETILGEDNAVAFKDYNDTLPYRNEVEALASSLSFTKSPLSEQQSEAVVRALRDVSEEFEYTVDLSERRGPELSGVSRQEVATYFQEREEKEAQVLESLAGALSEEQLAAYAERQLSERERDRRQMEFMLENPMPQRRFGGGGGRP